MSTSSWHNHGYGVCISNIEIKSVKKIKNLIKLVPKIEKEIDNYFKTINITNPTIEDYQNFSFDYGVAGIIKDVIFEKENIQFYACSDYKGNSYLLYEASYPWLIPEKEKNIKRKDIEICLKKYIRIITDGPIEIHYYDLIAE